MLGLLTTAVVLSPSFQVNSLSCVDHGENQRYCPQDPYPFYNGKYAPARYDIRVRNGGLVPRTRREERGGIGLSFYYEVECRRHDFLFRCVSGDVKVHVHPSYKWDDYVNVWLQCLVFTIVAMVCSPIIAALLFIGSSEPGYKHTSYFSDD